ncbi:mediator complex, subunit Med8 [Lineolata rhizophorae]|uniref:Mediator of RNA polymerase II transcription subunit 8 n=1 Tax=Lineolata rhizophorae TaxID=578093 RepID=A0A6A6NQ67_9PEZI|nr:mediator complex, subunit Med8 [Lineolata rhizophorae]
MSYPTNATSDEIKGLEATRQRLTQLVQSLNSLQSLLHQQELLPPWPALQQQSSVVAHHLRALTQTLQAHSTFLSSAHVYPDASTYPGRAQENLLNQLLRKRNDPAVEEWVAQGKELGEKLLEGSAEAADGQTELLEQDDLAELWEWAGPAANEVAKVVLFESGGDDLMDEDEDEDEEGSEAEAEAEGAGGGAAAKVGEEREKGKAVGVVEQPMMSLEDLYRFMSTGGEARAPRVVPVARR